MFIRCVESQEIYHSSHIHKLTAIKETLKYVLIFSEDREAFVTLATNDTYALGCLVLGSSLRRVGTTRKLAVMVTSGVSQSLR